VTEKAATLAIEQPGFERRRNRKTSHLIWWDGTLHPARAYALSKRFDEDVLPKLAALWQSSLSSLPRNSRLARGGIYGSWTYCPNAIADEVECIVRTAQGSCASDIDDI
jgi:hypothetical protein